MGQTFYAQADYGQPTMTVGGLIEQLRLFDPSAPLVFRSPVIGCFGPNTEYTIEHVNRVNLDHSEEHYPASTHESEETGELVTEEAYTFVRHAWSGIVIT